MATTKKHAEPLTQDVTINDFTVQVNATILDDYEFIELLAEAERGSLSAGMGAIKAVFPKGELDKLKEHLRDEHGVVSMQLMQDYMVKAISMLAPNS